MGIREFGFGSLGYVREGEIPDWLIKYLVYSLTDLLIELIRTIY
jgi:hypothetical protein